MTVPDNGETSRITRNRRGHFAVRRSHPLDELLNTT